MQDHRKDAILLGCSLTLFAGTTLLGSLALYMLSATTLMRIVVGLVFADISWWYLAVPVGFWSAGYGLSRVTKLALAEARRELEADTPSATDPE